MIKIYCISDSNTPFFDVSNLLSHFSNYSKIMVYLSNKLHNVSIIYSSSLDFVSSIFPSLFLIITVSLMTISLLCSMLLILAYFLFASAIQGSPSCFAMILSIVLLLLLQIARKIFSFTGSFQI